MWLSFGPFVLQFDERRVLDGEREVRLTPKAFELLKLLLDQRPSAVAKQEIFDRLWPDTYVSDNNLPTLITELRAALGDDANEPRYIRTVYGFGYAFIADAAARDPRGPGLAAVSKWVLVHDEREFPLREGENIVGRIGDGVIAFDAPSVSRRHARLIVSGGQVVLEDLNSKNGTWVGSTPVTTPTPVRDGNEVRLGSLLVTIRAVVTVASTVTIDEQS